MTDHAGGQGRTSSLGGHNRRIRNRISEVLHLGQNMVAEKLHPFVDDPVGKVADLVVLSANPLEEITNLRAVEIVIKGGEVWPVAQLLDR